MFVTDDTPDGKWSYTHEDSQHRRQFQPFSDTYINLSQLSCHTNQRRSTTPITEDNRRQLSTNRRSIASHDDRVTTAVITACARAAFTYKDALYGKITMTLGNVFFK